MIDFQRVLNFFHFFNEKCDSPPMRFHFLIIRINAFYYREIRHCIMVKIGKLSPLYTAAIISVGIVRVNNMYILELTAVAGMIII